MFDDFYNDEVSIVRPKKVQAEYGNATRLSYAPDDVTITDVDDLVDLQPQTTVKLDDQSRVATASGYVLHTQPGVDIALEPADRVRCRYGDLSVAGEVQRWPSSVFPNGIDHVEVPLELRTG